MSKPGFVPNDYPLTLIDKSSYVTFHPPQKNVQSLNLCFRINDKQSLREYCIKYLGVMIDSNLSWKNTLTALLRSVEELHSNL